MKEKEKNRARTQAREEQQSLMDVVNQFQSDVKYLRDITAQIDEYSGSGKSNETSRIESKISKVLAQVEEKKSELESLKPQLAQVRNAVNDQERYKKLLHENIDILGVGKRIEELGNEIERLQEDLSKVEGRDTAYAKHTEAKDRRDKAVAEQARIEGRWGGIVEHIRSLKVSFRPTLGSIHFVASSV